MALLRTFLSDTASSTDLHWQLITLGVTHELALSCLQVPGGTGRLIHSPALLRSLAITHLLYWPVALPNILLDRLLLKCDLTFLLVVLLASFLLCRTEICGVGVVALLHLLMPALQYRVLADCFHTGLLDHTHPSIRLPGGLAEVYPTRSGTRGSC